MNIETVISKDQETMYWYLLHHIAELKNLLQHAADSISFDELPTIVQSSKVEINEQALAAVARVAFQAGDQCRMVMQNIGRLAIDIESERSVITVLGNLGARAEIIKQDIDLSMLREAAANAVLTAWQIIRKNKDEAVTSGPWQSDGDVFECDLIFNGRIAKGLMFQVVFEAGSVLVDSFKMGVKPLKP